MEWPVDAWHEAAIHATDTTILQAYGAHSHTAWHGPDWHRRCCRHCRHCCRHCRHWRCWSGSRHHCWHRRSRCCWCCRRCHCCWRCWLPSSWCLGLGLVLASSSRACQASPNGTRVWFIMPFPVPALGFFGLGLIGIGLIVIFCPLPMAMTTTCGGKY